MAHNWLLYIAAFASAFAISIVMTPVAKTLSMKVGAIDYPKDRGMHKKPMPRMGGVAIVCGFIITVLMISPFVNEIEPKKLIGLLLGAIIIAVLGAFDDVKNLSAKFKLVVQIIAALIVIFSGIRIEFVIWPFTATFKALSAPFTLVWIIGVTNAVNLIDGLDGLAAGVSSIAALSIMVLCILTGSETAVVLMAALAGACIGFLPRNFNPAEIFMGDTGATFIGFVLSVTSILGLFKGYTILALVVSVFCLGLPIFDTLFAMGRRIVQHKPIMQADRGHLHHRLIDRGYSQKQAVVTLYILSIACGLLAIAISVRDIRVFLIVVLTVAVLSLVIYYFNHRIRRK
ncbi:MAG: undecaprenyl/decaprenyl-phosphate alpha-N-acetylglucosaminyl 1-phosphate transferase [Lachnospiraceae bacterium]|nr:undecaprenyl/decaprenyl-phosphate alpha-N-acetylglucosaminyl 1-phosphate transferase [Lachnospiraceae bacterium]